MNPSPTREGSSSAYEEPIRLSPGKSEPRREKLLSTRLFHTMCLAVLLIVASAASFSAFYEKWHFREQGARGTDLIAEFDRMIDGTANRPHIYRQLLPGSNGGGSSPSQRWVPGTKSLSCSSCSRCIRSSASAVRV